MLEEIRQLRDDQRALLEQIGLAFDSLDAQGRRVVTGRSEAQRQFDELQRQIDQVMELASQNNQILNELRDRGSGGGFVAPIVVPGDAEGGVTGDPGADEATTFFAAAQQQFRRGSYETARSGFTDFLVNYPDHELAPDAQYFLADTYAAEGDREQALAEYARVSQLWPDSRRAPTALYKSGMLEIERGNISEARDMFQRVELGYPNSPEAELARDQLRRLRS